MALTAIVEAFGQAVPYPEWVRARRIDEISTKILSQKKDLTRIDLYRYFSAYFAENNIYPTGDAIDLVEAYNKDAEIDKVISGKEFKSIQLPDVSEEVKAKVNAHIGEPNKSKLILTREFKIAVTEFKKKLYRNYYRPGLNFSKLFKDSLNVFGNKILPRIYKGFSGIDSLQIEFFLTSLQQINTLVDNAGNSGDAGKIARTTIKELMDDFFSFEETDAYHSLQDNRNGPAYNNNAMFFSYAAYHVPGYTHVSIKNDAPELPNANVYVYTRGKDGKWSQEPKPDAFNVYYGANGFKYRLTPGCDTLSFFRYHPTVPASTLPVILPRGSFCFVLQDIATRRLYLRPDINLRDNKVIDDKRLVKLCFKVEN